MRDRFLCAGDDRERRSAYVVIAVVLAALFVYGVTAGAQDASTAGTLSSVGATVPVPMTNVPALTVQLSGTWTGVVVFEVSPDGGATWYAATATDQQLAAVTPMLQAAGANGVWSIVNGGFTHARARALALGSGSVTVTFTRGLATVPTVPCNALLHAAKRC